MTEALKQRWRDPEWKYVPKEATDLRKTFARIRREQKEAAKPPAKASTVRALRKPGAK